MSQEYIVLDNSRFTTLIIDPTVSTNDKKFHCMYCGKILMTLNRKFAVASPGAQVYGSEIPLSVFRFTRMCGDCRHYYICYLETKGSDL